jgi:hypothetical protein
METAGEARKQGVAADASVHDANAAENARRSPGHRAPGPDDERRGRASGDRGPRGRGGRRAEALMVERAAGGLAPGVAR